MSVALLNARDAAALSSLNEQDQIDELKILIRHHYPLQPFAAA